MARNRKNPARSRRGRTWPESCVTPARPTVANRWITVTQRSGSAGADSAIAREILGYLENHPEAKDTLDGIAEWWLPHRRHERSAVERAVALLLSHGAIIETRRRGLPPYYQANRRAPPDVAARLERPERPEE